MTEQEYIDATNLAKLRIAHHAVHDCVFMRSAETVSEGQIRAALMRMIETLAEKMVLEVTK